MSRFPDPRPAPPSRPSQWVRARDPLRRVPADPRAVAHRPRRAPTALRGGRARIPPGGMRESSCDGLSAGAILTGTLGAGTLVGDLHGTSQEGLGIALDRSVEWVSHALADPWLSLCHQPWWSASARSIRHPHTAGSHRRMDAKQVWRAALGELQVSLSPANYETWLRDTQLVDVEDNRFRISVPNGFAKDWLETRYRSLISQTLAKIVGYSVQIEFVIGAAPTTPAETDGAIGPAAPTPVSQHVRVESTRVGG